MNRIAVLAALLCGLVQAASGQWEGLPQPVHITSDQGLPQAFNPAILQDRQGFIWMATLDGLCRYDGRNFRVFQPSGRERPSISSAAVIGLKKDGEGGIWIVTEKGTIDYFDPVKETFENTSQSPSFQKAFPWKPYEVLYDSRKTLWVGFRGQGLGAFEGQNLQTRHFLHDPEQPASLSHNDVLGILEDRQGNIWAGTGNGLDKLDPVSGKFRHYRHEKGNASSLPENFILGIYQRQDGHILVVSEQYVSLFHPEKGVVRSFMLPGAGMLRGERWEPVATQFATDREGNDYFTQYGNLYRFDPRSGVQLLTVNPSFRVQSVCVDRSNVLWLGTDGQGVYKFNLMAGNFRALKYEKNFHTDLLSKVMGIDQAQMPEFSPETSPYYFRATTDKKGRTWFNTGFTPFYRWDPATRRLDKIPFLFPVQSHEPAPPVPLATDPDGIIWALYDSTAAWYDEPARTWVKFPFAIDLPRTTGDQTGYMRLLQFTADDTDLWIITNTHGLFRVNRTTGRIRRYAHNPSDASTLSSDALFCISDDPGDSNILWIGTFGNGLCRFEKKTGQSRRFTEENGLPNNVVYAAIPDTGGYLWIATNKGICSMHRATFDTKTYTRADGLQADEFNRFHFLHLPDDRIVLGGLEGITAFYPGQITEDAFEPRTEIISIRINNELMLPADTLPVHQAKYLELGSDQNFITVGFAGLQFNNPGKMHFRYLLEGVNADWVVSDRPEAIYTNLDPGTYALKLNVSNTSGKWSPHVRTLTFRIASPWWATWWAYALYALAVTGIMYGAARLYLKQKEAAQLMEVNDLKTRFFTNITHEFRTPLTLILSPVQQLRKAASAPSEWQKNEFRLDLIERNANQLLQLVNQLLDLARIEAGTMEVHRQQGDLTGFVHQLVDSFRDQAAGKDISLLFRSDLGERQYWFDAPKLESVVYNLVANAIKFTGNGGSVRVALTSTEGGIGLEVSDTGKGIPESKLAHIFDRFYQLDDSATREQEGSGIGLALVKELTGFMGGHIRVKSKVGKGSAFTVVLPFKAVEGKEQAEQPRLDAPLPRKGLSDAEAPGGIVAETPPVILLVEDNKELSDFIADCLPTHYRVEQALNGQEGFEKAVAVMPDMIISDVLMPVMDGYTLCHQLKTDLRTSHIPVILLTAKVSQDSRLEGLSQGADHYLTKPFHPDELRLQVANLLEQQRKYSAWLQSQIGASAVPQGEISGEISDPFIKKIYELLEANLDDTAYDVNELATALGMHRATLFRKIKTLTGLPPNDLIRAYRMRRAAQFLGKGAPVSETAYKVGFDNLSYFSKCFREQFGMTPSEYGRQHS